MNRLGLRLSRIRFSAAAVRPWASQQALRPTTSLPRPFSTTPTYLKKAKSSKAPPPASRSPSANDPEDAGPAADPQDPGNFGDVTARFAHLSARFQDELKQSRQGGAMNPTALSALSVPTREGPFPLRELAQVVPRSNRTISLLVNDASHVKHIMSAVQASPAFNQQPQRDPENELELIMKVEVERPEEVQKKLKEVCHTWRERVRNVRSKRDKVISGWKKDGSVTTDVAKKLATELTNIMRKELAVIDKAEAQAVAQAERSRG